MDGRSFEWTMANLQLPGTIEDLFNREGKPRHEIVFVYDGRFVDTLSRLRGTEETLIDLLERPGWVEKKLAMDPVRSLFGNHLRRQT